MGNFSAGQLRNICFAGHGRAGKTTLLEAMLFHSGAIDRMGSVSEGTTTSDFDAEETKDVMRNPIYLYFDYDKDADEMFERWFGPDSNQRKQLMEI